MKMKILSVDRRIVPAGVGYNAFAVEDVAVLFPFASGGAVTTLLDIPRGPLVGKLQFGDELEVTAFLRPKDTSRIGGKEKNEIRDNGCELIGDVLIVPLDESVYARPNSMPVPPPRSTPTATPPAPPTSTPPPA